MSTPPHILACLETPIYLFPELILSRYPCGSESSSKGPHPQEIITPGRKYGQPVSKRIDSAIMANFPEVCDNS